MTAWPRESRLLYAGAPDEWPMLERIYIERLLDFLEDRYEPAQVDAAVERFVERLRERPARGPSPTPELIAVPRTPD